MAARNRTDTARLTRTDRPYFPVVHDAQELGLMRLAQAFQLIQEKRPPVRLLQKPHLVTVRSGARAGAVAEKLAFEEFQRGEGDVLAG